MILAVFYLRQLYGLCTFNICLAYNKCCANQSSWNDIMNSNALFLKWFFFLIWPESKGKVVLRYQSGKIKNLTAKLQSRMILIHAGIKFFITLVCSFFTKYMLSRFSVVYWFECKRLPSSILFHTCEITVGWKLTLRNYVLPFCFPLWLSFYYTSLASVFLLKNILYIKMSTIYSSLLRLLYP